MHKAVLTVISLLACQAAIAAGEDRAEQLVILHAWVNWYREALNTTTDIEVGGSSPETLAAIEAAIERVTTAGEEYVNGLSGG